jgi:hypothetical protein
MASTRNKNTHENYKIETQNNRFQKDYTVNKNYGKNNNTFLPDFGINPTQLPGEHLAKHGSHSIDVESSLFGINASNLVDPRTPVAPHTISRDFVHFWERPEVIMPGDLVIERDQRPLRKG